MDYKKLRKGEVHKTNEGFTIKIVEYNAYNNCDIIIMEGGHLLRGVAYNNIIRGGVKNPFNKTIYQVGYLGVGKYMSRTIGYYKWRGIIRRCYDEKLHIKNPTYKNCTVVEEWHNYQVFGRWFEKNYNAETMQGWHIDKDILFKGNKIYSPDTCCFVPREINNLFLKRKKCRGECPIGVNKLGKNFTVNMGVEKGSNHKGTFKTAENAFQVYKEEKEKRIKELADRWKGNIAPNVYKALYNYKVEITD